MRACPSRDRLLADPELVNIVHQVLQQRRPLSRTRGRLSTPTEVVLRLLVLKHARNWSYAVLAREVRANLSKDPTLRGVSPVHTPGDAPDAARQDHR